MTETLIHAPFADALPSAPAVEKVLVIAKKNTNINAISRFFMAACSYPGYFFCVSIHKFFLSYTNRFLLITKI
jgi:hypothetical protein